MVKPQGTGISAEKYNGGTARVEGGGESQLRGPLSRVWWGAARVEGGGESQLRGPLSRVWWGAASCSEACSVRAVCKCIVLCQGMSAVGKRCPSGMTHAWLLFLAQVCVAFC